MVGRNDPCPCGSRLKLKKCCLNLLLDGNATSAELGRFLTSSDLWPDHHVVRQPAEVLRQFDGLKLVQTLARLNYAMAEQPVGKASPIELAILKEFLPPLWYRKALLWLVETKKRWTALPRATLLEGIRTAMVESVVGGDRKEVTANQHDVGKALLDISQLSDRRSGTTPPSSGARASLFGIVFRDQPVDFGSFVARYWGTIVRATEPVREKFPNEFFDFAGCYEQRTGVAIDATMTAGIAIFLHYDGKLQDIIATPGRFLIGHRFWDEVLPESRDTCKRAFGSLSLTWERHVQEAIASSGSLLYQNFYRAPMLEQSEGVFFPLDVQYLGRRATEGVYWQLFEILLAERRGEEAALRNYFGRAFEWYASEVLRSSLSGLQPRALWLDWDGDFSGCTSRPDAVVREGNVLYFVELTTSSVMPSVAMSGDAAKIEAALRSIWFGDNRDSAKLFQMNAAVQAFRNGTLVLEGLEQEAIALVVPIYVSLRQVSPFFRSWYDELMRGAGLPPEFVRDLRFVDIDELESLCASKEADGTWNDVFSRLDKSKYSSVRNLFVFVLGEMPRHKLSRRFAWEAWNAATQRLFGRPMQPYQESAAK